MKLFYPYKVVLIVFSSKVEGEIKVHGSDSSLPGAGRDQFSAQARISRRDATSCATLIPNSST